MITDHELGCIVGITALPDMGSGRVRWLVDTYGPVEALAAATSGDVSRLGHPPPVR